MPTVAKKITGIDGHAKFRFMSKVGDRSTENGCWNWIGGCGNKGYGVFNHRRSAYQAHRFAYTMFIGPVDPLMTVDHLCRNRACVNPDHLEVVTNLVNIRRGNAGINGYSKTHCKRGHEFNDENTKINVAGMRQCVPCLKMLNHQCYERRKIRLGPEGLKLQWHEAHERQRERKK